jgi:hypothetical protein
MRKDYRQNKMGGGMMRSTYKAGTTNPKNKKLAAMYGDKNKITRGDIITAAKKNAGERKNAMGGGMMRKNFSKGSDYHTTKDGRRVKKGLYYYMNKAKKEGRSKPGKGSVTDKALKQSAKTAKA